MALVKSENSKQPMATVAAGQLEDENDDALPVKGKPAMVRVPGAPSTGFFSIYKKGQGKWTRLGTVFAAAGVGIGTAFALYGYVEPYVAKRNVILGICLAFLAVYSAVIFWVMNKPNNAEFLIATDSEMKKVNWTTQGELLGSTRVVVLFLVFVALFLFGVDLIFAEFFHLISVLRTSPFQ